MCQLLVKSQQVFRHAVENIEEYFPLPEHLTSTHNSDIFILSVAGDSYDEAGAY